jgi:hypothetical protein
MSAKASIRLQRRTAPAATACRKKNAVSVKLDAFRDGGTVMPNAFVVLRLILKVTCSPARSGDGRPGARISRHRVPAYIAKAVHEVAGTGVCTENLNPNVLMMKSAQDSVRTYDAGSLYRPRNRRIFMQRSMRSDAVVIIGVRFQNAAQMLLAEDNEVIQTLTPDRSDQPFGKAILPR